MPSPTPKKQPSANPFPWLTANPQPGFNFGAGVNDPNAQQNPLLGTNEMQSQMPLEMPMGSAPAGPGASSSGGNSFNAILQAIQGAAKGATGQVQPQGPDLLALLKEIQKPKDLTNAYNIGSQLPSGAGSQFNPFNNSKMFGSRNPDGSPRV